MTYAGTIAFAWSGLPDYAARCIRAVARRHPGRVAVVGTRPSVPIEGMEVSLGQTVTWIDGTRGALGWSDLGLHRPSIFFQGGYRWPAFRALGRECRSHGGKVVLLNDAGWRRSWRQVLVDPVRHRLLLNRHFDACLIPGEAGRRFSTVMGHRADAIETGLYGADPVLFGGGPPLAERPKTFLFVGRLVAVKNVLALAAAFARLAEDQPDWSLRICGSGALAGAIPAHPRIRVHGFLQPAALAEVYRTARCLVLPSLHEPWGLVVHEAALSGCALALSHRVGAAADLARPANAVLFRPGSVGAIEAALRAVAAWDDGRWRAAEARSRGLAARFGPEPFADAADRLLGLLGADAQGGPAC